MRAFNAASGEASPTCAVRTALRAAESVAASMAARAASTAAVTAGSVISVGADTRPKFSASRPLACGGRAAHRCQRPESPPPAPVLVPTPALSEVSGIGSGASGSMILPALGPDRRAMKRANQDRDRFMAR
jgi:hypothetical protein